MNKLVTFLAVPVIAVCSFGIVSAHSNNCSDEWKADCQSEGKVFVCHNDEEKGWVILHEKKELIQKGDFLYNGPKPREATWCVDHQPETPPPVPPTPASVPPPTPTPAETPPPSSDDSTPPPVNTFQGK